MRFFTAAAFLFTALVVILVGPLGAAPTPAASPNCLLKSQGVDSDKMGSLLNMLLSITIQLLYNYDDPCKKQDLIGQMEEAMGDLVCFMNEAPEEGKGLLSALLNPLLKAVGQLLEALLGSDGVLDGLLELLSEVVNLILCLLNSLNLNLDLNVMLQLGDLINLDLGTLLNLG